MSVDRLLLPGERILWEGQARPRPLGPAAFEAAIGGGCLLVVFLVLVALLLATTAAAFTRRDPEVLVGQAVETLVAILVGVIAWRFVKGVRADLKKRRAESARRYLVTTARVLVIGADLDDERIVALEDLAAERTCVHAGRSVRLLRRSGEVALSFDALEQPDAAVIEIERALGAARDEPRA